MADDLVKSITDKPVKDTVADADSKQASVLDEVKKKVSEATGLLSGMSSVMSNAKNLVSQSVSGITSNIEDSVKKFSSTANIGLKTTLGDLTNKHGSMMSDVEGRTNQKAITDKPGFITNLTDSSIGNINIKGSNSDSLLKNFSSGDLSKLASSAGLSSISNNSMLRSAMSSNSGLISSLTSGAKSVLSSIGGSTISKAVNSSAGSSLISSVVKSVTSLAGKAGIGSTSSLISDMSKICKYGAIAYSLVSDKNGNALKGITSNYNTSYNDVFSLMNMSSEICPGMNGSNLSNYYSNKSLNDLLIQRMAQQGMYGAINQMLGCQNSQQYIDNQTYSMMSDQMYSRASYGDVYTTSALQQGIGNSRVYNRDSLMYDLAYNMDDSDSDTIDEYNGMLSRMQMNGRDVTGSYYGSSNGNVYVYSSGRTNNLYNRNPSLVSSLTGGNTTAAVVSLISNLFD